MKTTDLTPLANKVLLLPEPYTPSSTIAAPENFEQPPPTKATVLALGIKRYDKPGGPLPRIVAVGDLVAIDYDRGMPVDINGVEHLIMREDAILAIIDK